MGAGFGLALSTAGHDVTLLIRTERPTPPGVGRSIGTDRWREAVERAAVVLVATPDNAIPAVAGDLLALGGIGPAHAVLHLSGLLDYRALDPLAPSGAALGSLHPLQSIADPAAGPARLRGAYAAIEGEPRAQESAAALAHAAGMIPVVVPSSAKPAYHAAATIASNYSVALAGLAERIAEAAGLPPGVTASMYLPLMRGTIDNLVAGGTVAALTGAIRRGDIATVRAHLAALTGPERRLYALLGLETLRIAREGGLEGSRAAELEELLRAAG